MLVLLTLIACDNVSGVYVPKESEPLDSEDPGGGGTTDDTADTDGDLDDDGFTPDDGDCDDNDIYVSPARDEIPDEKDNDCDGRIDEEWSGVDVAWLDTSSTSAILTIDSIGRVTEEVELSSECYPFWIDHLPDGGWAINNGYGYVTSVDSAGNCTDLADFSETDYGVWGLAVGKDGLIYATTIDKLWSVSTDGTTTEVTSWTVDFEDISKHEAAISGVAVDWATGELGLFDYFGGFATWSAEAGLQIHKIGDWSAPALITLAGAARDGKGWYALAGDTATGDYGIYRFDLDAGDWTLVDAWSYSDFSPMLMAIDGDSGDFYATANGGWYETVWRVVAGSGYAADLYMTDGTISTRDFTGIVSNY